MVYTNPFSARVSTKVILVQRSWALASSSEENPALPPAPPFLGGFILARLSLIFRKDRREYFRKDLLVNSQLIINERRATRKILALFCQVFADFSASIFRIFLSTIASGASGGGGGRVQGAGAGGLGSLFSGRWSLSRAASGS